MREWVAKNKEHHRLVTAEWRLKNAEKLRARRPLPTRSPFKKVYIGLFEGVACEMIKCTKCHVEKPVRYFSRYSKQDGLRSRCKKCCVAISKRTYRYNPEKEALWRKNNPEKCRLVEKKYLLTSSYANKMLKRATGLTEAPPELIEAKRTHLKMVRTLREK